MDKRRKLVIDCDPGHDDIMAIMNALAHPELFEILGYTTVCGNNYVDKVTSNLCKVLTAIGVDGTVAVGYDAPMVLAPDPQPAAHGESGLDGPVLPEAKVRPVAEHAVEFLHDVCSQAAAKGEKLTIVALAPLTNIALFLKTWPELAGTIEEITLMGGSRGKGNILPRAEFNLYADPHAAKLVFASGVPIVMSDIEICVECGTEHVLIDGLKGQGKVQDLAHDILQFFSQYGRRRGLSYSPVFDLVPVMHMMHPELFTEKKCRVLIETEGAYTRGMTIVEEAKEEAEANVTLVEHCVDNEAYNRYFMENLKLLDEMVKEKQQV